MNIMNSVYIDAEGLRWEVSISEKDGTFNIVSIQQEEQSIESTVSATLRKGKVILSDGRKATIAKVGDDWWVHLSARTYRLKYIEPGSSSVDTVEGGMTAPMPGTVIEVLVIKGDRVQAEQHLMTMEAMKMEHKIVASESGVVSAVHCSKGQKVEQGFVLIELEASG